MSFDQSTRNRAERYLAFLRSSEGRTRQEEWQEEWEELYNMVRRDPSHAWELIQASVDCAKDDVDLAFIGAGPLEDLLVCHAEYLPHAIDAARRDGRLRQALSSADIRGGASDHEVLANFLDEQHE